MKDPVFKNSKNPHFRGVVNRSKTFFQVVCVELEYN